MKVALVTGGAVRLGRAIVEELAGANWSVAFSYRTSGAAALALAGELADRGCDVAGIEADVDDGRARTRLVQVVLDRYGGLDALVNNAAVFPRTPFPELTEDAFQAVLQTNLAAPVFLAQACAEALRARRGSIVNIADVYGFQPLRHHLAYSVSKAALLAATRALAVELAPEVRVNAVAPGIALFPPDYDEAKRQRLLDRTLLEVEGGAGEIARTVSFLLEGAATMTGQVLVVDGGRLVGLEA
jgi:pteridine reductase